MKFYVYFSNANGPTHNGAINLNAKTIFGAKRESWQYASGGHTNITICDKNGTPIAARSSIDKYWGFSRGAEKWVNY